MDHTHVAWTAKVSLSHLLDRRTPRTFLRRNLNLVLDCHERQLSGEPSSAFVNNNNINATIAAANTHPNSEDSITNNTNVNINIKRPAAWSFLDLPEDMARNMLKASQPTLTISSLQLRVGTSHPSIIASPVQSPARDGDPEWLPRPGEAKTPCQITVAVYDDLLFSRRQIYMDLRPATITTHQVTTGGPDVLTIELESPFRIAKEQMAVARYANTDEDYWTRELGADCTLEIGLQFHNSKQTADLLRKIEGTVSTYQPPGNEGIVRALWSKLPDLPPAGHLLPLKREKNRETLNLKYGLEAVMSWNKPCSPLVRFHNVLRREGQELRQLPTPASDGMDDSAKRCTIKYLFVQGFQTRSAALDDFKCLLCPYDGKHASFERLRLHFLTYHEHFRFEVEENTDDGHEFKVVRISLANDTGSPGDKGDFSWVAPRTPFSINSHLKGEGVWATERPKIRQAKKNTKGVANEQGDLLASKRNKRKLRPPEDVKSLPEPKRRRYRVPEVPGVRFYRTTSKQLVEPGTELSETDEEERQPFRRHVQRRELKLLGSDEYAQDFHELLNKTLDAERPMSDILIRDTIVRFVVTYKAKLCEARYKELLETKLKQLKSRLIIGREDFEFCMDQVYRSPSQKVEVLGHKEVVAEKLVPPTNVKRPGCVCGEPVQGIRGTIACGDPACGRDYHMSCLGLQTRAFDWLCPSCSERSSGV